MLGLMALAVLAGWGLGQGEGFWHELAAWALQATGIFAVLLASFFLFPAIVTMVMGLLLDDVAEAVEDRHYPGLPAARPQPVMEILGEGLRLVAVTLAVNLLLLPVYLLLMFVPPLNVVLFYLVNGYLLSREYFDMVAVRRLPPKTARHLRKANRGPLLVAGMAIAFLLTIPFVNLAMPIAATGVMVHLFEHYRRRAGMAATRA